MKVRIYRAQIEEISDLMTSSEIVNIPPTHFEPCNPDEKLTIGQDLAEHKTYPIIQWAELIRGERHNYFVVLADEILQKIFNQEKKKLQNYRNELAYAKNMLQQEKEYSAYILEEINHKYSTVPFLQRLKYLFTRKIK